jgi:hypothetical protein
MKPIALALAALTLSGCLEFVGDLAQIGFSSNLTTGAEAWTPEHPIADNSVAVFEAEQLMKEKARSQESLNLVGTTRGRIDQHWSEEKRVAVSGSNTRGTVHYTGDARDRFTIRFRTPAAATFSDPTAAMVEMNRPYPITFAVPVGATLHPVVTLHDRRGRTLGYVANELDLIGGETVDSYAGQDHRFDLTAASIGEEHIIASYLGEPLRSHRIQVVDPEDVSSIELETVVTSLGDDEVPVLYVRAVGMTVDGLEVYGLPVEWTWSENAERLDVQDGSVLFDLSSSQGDSGTLHARFGGLDHQAEIHIADVNLDQP